MSSSRATAASVDPTAGVRPVNPRWLRTNLPCRAACPVGTHAGGYVSLVAAGRHREAYLLARRPNPFASVCGRICAHPCESVCRRGDLDAPIGIRAVKRFVTERHGVESERSFEEILSVVERPRPPSTEPGRVAVIGAGPAGLSCAHDLALMGHRVTVFDSAQVAGGMLRMGIPEYRLPRELIQCEVDFIEYLGVDIRLGVEIGRQVTFEALAADHDAVFLACGCRKGSALRLPGNDLSGVVTAIDFLVAANLGQPVALGQRIAVIGGGNTAFDAARSARRLAGTHEPEEEHDYVVLDSALAAARQQRGTAGSKVSIVYRRSQEEMPADDVEIHEALEEEIEILFLTGPTEVVGEDGRVTGLRCQRMELGPPDASGRRRPEAIPGSEFVLDVDTVLVATGQYADLSFLGEDHGMELSPWNTVEVDPGTLATSRQGIWAGGDVAFGPRIAIDAVADGRRAALAIDSHLTGRSDDPTALAIKVFDSHGYDHPFSAGDYDRITRERIPTIPVTRRTQQAQVEVGYTEEQARMEGSRCLHCWINTVFDSRRMAGSECIQCGGCVDVCPVDCIDLVSLRRVARDAGGDSPVLRSPDGRPLTLLPRAGAALIKDETTCIRCGLCARRCPVDCITMQGWYVDGEQPVLALCEQRL